MAAMDMDISAYQLSAVLAGHEEDVRAVGSIDDAVITGSRDKTARLWRPSGSAEGGYVCASTLEGHTHYVMTVAATAEGAIASGSNDKHVIVWDLEGGRPSHVLEGHTDTVSCVRASQTGALFSASWDKTARVWRGGECVRKLEGHAAALWGVLPLDDDESVLTASADRTIKLWRAAACERTFEGHTDVVRDLIA